MDFLPLSIKNKCREILGTSILSSKYIGGGDINHARLLETSKSRFFLKFNTNPDAFLMFQKEAKGLNILRNADAILIPKVIAIGKTEEASFLILEYIESGYRKNNFWEIFGQKLALLHQNTQENFGLDHSNFIGSLVQKNNPHSTWTDFFINERLLPQIELATDSNKIQRSDIQIFNTLFKKISTICPNEIPALTHGDLWSGNFITNEKTQPVLIDPAVSFSHREMDLAMTKLFGGFDSEFYESYQSVFPLKPGFNQRVEIYQLYYLMVHVNLFGGGYLNSVRRILKKYAS